MAWRGERDDDEDEYDENDLDEEPDYGDEDDEAETVACPHCRREILEDAERCPYCGRYITDEDLRKSGKPWWLFLGVAVCLYLVYSWIVNWW